MTADCLPKWKSWFIKTYFSSKLFFFMPESKLHTQHIPLLLKKIIRALEVPQVPQVPLPADPIWNMEKSSQYFGAQSLKIEIVQKFYLSGQI